MQSGAAFVSAEDCLILDHFLMIYDKHELMIYINSTQCFLPKSLWEYRIKTLSSKYGISIHFQWQFIITIFGFWLVNILLLKFDTSSKKEMKMIKTHIFWWKTTRKCQKSVCKQKAAFFTLKSPHWSVIKHALNCRDTEEI